MPYGRKIGPLRLAVTYQPVQVAENLACQFQDKVVVDLGAGGRRIVPWVKTVDFSALPGTDYVCDFVYGQTPFGPASVDLVISTGVLEHVANEALFMQEIRRILKDGGTLHIEIPFLQQYHEDPIDCRRLTLPGLRLFLQQHGFQIINSGVHIGPTVMLLTLLRYYADLLFRGPHIVQRVLARSAFLMVFALFWPLSFLDAWLIRKPDAHRLASGVYATATKQPG